MKIRDDQRVGVRKKPMPVTIPNLRLGEEKDKKPRTSLDQDRMGAAAAQAAASHQAANQGMTQQQRQQLARQYRNSKEKDESFNYSFTKSDASDSFQEY